MGLYENVKEAAKSKGYSINRLEKELGFARSYISKFKNITPSADKIQKIADFLGVTSEFLMNGKENSSQSELTAKDSRDISKDLDSIMAKLTAGEDGPASYNGEELSPEAAELFRDELEIALKRLKLINKDKYTPKKYKKQVKYLNRDIKKIVSYYKRKTGTTDPFEIADQLGILYQVCNLQFEGCYMFLKNRRYIFINKNLPEYEKRLVMAHELGHAILHRKENCYFIRNKTLLLNSKKEIEANRFAMELLIPDSLLEEYREFTIEQISRITGYHQKLIELKMHN